MEHIVSPRDRIAQPTSKLRSAGMNSIEPAFAVILPIVARTSSAAPDRQKPRLAERAGQLKGKPCKRI
jgi:hypothetical protein